MRKLATRTEASTPSPESKEFTSSHPLERSNDIYEDLSSEGEEALEHPLASVKDIRRRKSTHFQEVSKEEYIEPWNAWSALPYQFIRVRRGGAGAFWLYAYSLENRGLVWGGSLKIAWALDGMYGGLELDQDHGTPAINLYDKTGLDNPNYAEVRDACMHSAHNFILCSSHAYLASSQIWFDDMNFVYAEPATPAVREGGGRPRVLRATHRIGEPVKTKVNGMSGFVFFCDDKQM